MEHELINPTNEEMSTSSTVKKTDHVITVGYGLLLLSFILYSSCEYFDLTHKNQFLIFWVHYLFCVIYTGVLIAAGAYGIRKSWKKENISKTIIALNLYLISAYVLNREMQVFQNSVPWLCYYILLNSATLLSFRYFDRFPAWINGVQYFLVGTALCFYLYLSIYAANYYIFGIAGILGFGIGLHIFVPLTLVTACICLILQNRSRSMLIYWTIGSMVSTLIIVVLFVVEWHSRVTQIERVVNQSVMHHRELPVWVTVAQDLESDWISERILKSRLVYTVVAENMSDWRFMPGSVSWDEIKRHDPLVLIASIFSRCSLSKEECVTIYKAISGKRHQANERLWSGDNLSTAYVVSDVDIYPELRLAYTEKYLNVRNNSDNGSWWGNTEEGIYTFYLPEGSVVTSLSLWINGKEEKGILTSKQKATKAYNTIVGVEVRDPSVIHWQEGNTVTVRVFPCTSNEERKFKIGITSPLQEVDGKITYHDVAFQGPTPIHANETKRIRFIEAPVDLQIPSYFTKDKKGDYIAEGNYDPDFTLSFKALPLKSNHFTFDGFVYALSEYKPSLESLTFKNLYLDINQSWTTQELEAIKELSSVYAIYAFIDEERIQLTNENQDEILEDLHKKNFSVFPFHKAAQASQSLIITKGEVMSPHLNDFEESEFAEKVSQYFAANSKVNVFNLQGSHSTYINSLRELRGLEFMNGTVSDLKDLLAKNTFVKTTESENRIILHDAKMIISKTKIDSDTFPNTAPDHLARLFAYNNIMRKVGTRYFTHDYMDDALVEEAATAYVVSPVSSLIVLETQEDYKRFDISDKENSLHNATKNSTGAVPEPHEWALIILLILFALFLQFRSSLTFKLS